MLESHWKEIRDEGLANLNEKGLFEVEAEDLRDTGDWKQFTLYTQGTLYYHLLLLFANFIDFLLNNAFTVKLLP